MKYVHWAVQTYHIKQQKYERTHNKGFTVKLCPTCNNVWEKHFKEIMVHTDFPRRGLREKECKYCKEKNEKQALDRQTLRQSC